MARNNPLRMLKSASFGSRAFISCRTVFLPKTTGVRNATVHSSRKAAVTAEGASEYLTKMADREMPIMPTTIIIMGCFSMYFMEFFFRIRIGRL